MSVPGHRLWGSTIRWTMTSVVDICRFKSWALFHHDRITCFFVDLFVVFIAVVAVFSSVRHTNFNPLTDQILTQPYIMLHCQLMMHISIIEVCHPWHRNWFIDCSAVCLILDKYLIVPIWTFRKAKFDGNYEYFVTKKLLNMPVVNWQQFPLCFNMLPVIHSSQSSVIALHRFLFTRHDAGWQFVCNDNISYFTHRNSSGLTRQYQTNKDFLIPGGLWWPFVPQTTRTQNNSYPIQFVPT